MKKTLLVIAVLAIGSGIYFGRGSIIDAKEKILELFETDPDMGRFESTLSREEYMTKRSEYIAGLRGLDEKNVVDPQARPAAIRDMEEKETLRTKLFKGKRAESLLAAWTEIGPNPIPNGQTSGVSTAVSGRTISLAVHPTNPNLVYAGTAQGGLYRTSDGGATWTPLMDNALSLAIGAIAIAPSQPDTIYVGTGEANFSLDSFFGVGVYRIDNASTASPTISGPFNKDAGNADVFTGRAVAEIIVHPTDPNTIFVASGSGVGGIGGVANNVLPVRGIYRSTNAGGAAPTFTKLTGLAGNINASVRDIAIDPLNPNLLVAIPIIGGGGGGIYVSTDALAANPTFTQRVIFNSTSTNELTGEFAVQHTVGAANPTIYAAVGNVSGGLYINTDGGTVWTLQNATNFCSPQCFYDIAIDVDPTNPANVYLGGAPALIFGRSINSGVAFTTNATTAVGLHSDSHAIAVAPSQPATIYFASDGGVWRSANSGTNWTSLNNTTIKATQFMGLAVHPTDPNFTIGGTQDNGTNFYQPGATWTRADFGDGGFAAIDQNAANNTNVTMYHTYFNQTNNLIGFARVSATTCASDGNWAFKGVGAGVFTNACGDTEAANGITALDAVLFYAPLKLGPGNPNTVYFGTDRLYRSINRGDAMVLASQAPITSGIPISAIGISPTNDNVRIVGQTDGGIWGTTTGAATLTNLDTGGAVPNAYVGRTVIDPNNANTAYVTLASFGVVNVWKTINLNAATPSWTAAAGSGLTAVPQVPVSAFIVDPLNSSILYAGTDIGVYSSLDGGATWAPFGTGLPRVAVFDMAITPGRLVRIATHGRGMWQTPAAPPTAAGVIVSGRVLTSEGRGLTNAKVHLSGPNGESWLIMTGRRGTFSFEDIPSGESYILSVSSRRLRYEPRILSLSDSVEGLELYPVSDDSASGLVTKVRR